MSDAVVPSAIELRGVHKAFRGTPVLRGLDLGVRVGETFTILGGSGTGKSVCLKHVLGLLRPDAGSVRVFGRDVTQLSEDELVDVRKDFGMVFQGAALFDSLSVFENVAFPLREHLSLDDAALAARVGGCLAAVGLAGIEALLPAELSGGMRKRVGLARAIATEPEILFFDEPTTGLDPIMGDVINDLIVECVGGLGATALTITHDMASARKIADRIAMIYQGKIVWAGPVARVDDSGNAVVDQFIHGRTEGPIRIAASAT